MAAAALPADQAADLLKNLSLDSRSKIFQVSKPTKKPTVGSGDKVNGQSQPPLIPYFMDPTVAYGYASSAYYYGGYDWATNGWDDSHGGYGYAPYGPHSPVGSPGLDGRAQHYQYPSPYFQPNGQSPAYQNTVFNSNGSGTQNGFQDPRVHSSVPCPIYSNGLTRNNANSLPFSNANGFASKNQNTRPLSHLASARPMAGINAASGYMNKMYPNKLNVYGSGLGYGSSTYWSPNGNGWFAVNNAYKPRGRGNNFFSYSSEDGLNELNRGPRARITNTQTDPIATAKGHNNTDGVEKEKACAATDREQYNLTDFPETYTDAKFFIIKSYSEDDVHKSVKYNVWSSTQNGNKKLDAAYHEAQQKSEKCPVFLFFSVNTSGQFVGVAEMVGPVDFDKSFEYWQQDKWVGCFPVKWHIVKDVPNSLLKHIILEYNENKPVTNSRDTQEVKLEQGLQVIKVFKDHSSKQCILDDFEFYEERQKRIQEKKAKQQFQKQAWEEKLSIVEKNKEEIIEQELVKHSDAESVLVNGVANGC